MKITRCSMVYLAMADVWLNGTLLSYNIRDGDDVAIVPDYQHLFNLYNECVRRNLDSAAAAQHEFRVRAVMNVDIKKLPDFSVDLQAALIEVTHAVESGWFAFITEREDKEEFLKILAVGTVVRKHMGAERNTEDLKQAFSQMREKDKASNSVTVLSKALADGAVICSTATLYGQVLAQHLGLQTCYTGGWYHLSDGATVVAGSHAWNILETRVSYYIIDFMNGHMIEKDNSNAMYCPAIFPIDKAQFHNWAEEARNGFAFLELQGIGPSAKGAVAYFGNRRPTERDNEKSFDPFKAGVPIIRNGGWYFLP